MSESSATPAPEQPVSAAAPPAAEVQADVRDWDDALDLDPDDYQEIQAARDAKAAAATDQGAPATDAAKAGGDTSAPAADPAAVKPASPEPTPAATAHPKGLVERAKALGIDDTESYSTADLRAEVQQAIDFHRLREPTSPPPQRPQPKPEAAADGPADVLAELGIDKEKWEPEIVGAFEKLAKHTADLQKRLDGFDSERKQAGLVSTYDALDGFFAGLPDDDKARFGDGDRFTLKADAPEIARRMALVRAAGIDLSDPPPAKQLERALKAAHAALYPPVARPAAAPNPAERPVAHVNGNGHQPPAAPPRNDKGQFVKADDPEERAREEAWMRSASPMPTERRGNLDLPQGEPGTPERERWVQSRLAVRLRARSVAVGDDD